MPLPGVGEVKSPDSDRYEYPDSFTVNSSDVLPVSREKQELIKKAETASAG